MNSKKSMRGILTSLILGIAASGLTANDTYYTFNHIIKMRTTRQGAVKIIGSKKMTFIAFAQKLNNYILAGDSDGLFKHFSKEVFKYYYLEKNSENIIDTITIQFQKRSGLRYERIFNIQALTSRMSEPGDGRGNQFDIRKYLQNYHKNLKWEVLLFPESNEIEVWFSIPDDIIEEFSLFHYRIKEIDGKFVLIGL